MRQTERIFPDWTRSIPRASALGLLGFDNAYQRDVIARAMAVETGYANLAAYSGLPRAFMRDWVRWVISQAPNADHESVISDASYLLLSGLSLDDVEARILSRFGRYQ